MRKALVPVLIVLLAVTYWQLYIAALNFVLGWDRPNALMAMFDSRVTGARAWLLLQQIVAVVLPAIPVSLAVCYLAKSRAWAIGLAVSALSLIPHLVDYADASEFVALRGYPLVHLLLTFGLILGSVPIFSHLLNALPARTSPEHSRGRCVFFVRDTRKALAMGVSLSASMTRKAPLNQVAALIQ